MRFYTFLCGLALAASLLPHNLGLATKADGQTVVINELLWMGSSMSSADEWIELRNITSLPVDISGWQLTKKSSGVESTMLTIPSGAQIAPNGFFLISNYTNVTTSSSLNMVPDVVTTEVALVNSALQVKLYNASHALVDAVDDGTGNPLAGAYDSEKKIYASMERNPVPGDGTLATNWHTASRSVGFKPGTTELGTPGTTNSNGVPVAMATETVSGIAQQPTFFDGGDSYDPEGQLLTFTWDFGDGAISSDVTPQHVYAAAGAYTATLRVDDGLDQATVGLKVTITAAPAAATTPEPVPASTADTPMTTSCRGLVLSELYPNPPGVDADEFIELYNAGEEDVPVAGCSVWTSATRKFSLQDSTMVARGQWYVLHKSVTKITLNNGGTTVRLLDSDGSELDRAVYGKAAEGQAWALIDKQWQWTMRLTAGGANISVEPNAATMKAAKIAATTARKKVPAPPAVEVTLDAVQNFDSGDRVAVRGRVIAPRGALGSTLIAIESDDGGVIISVPDGERSLSLGDVIAVNGKVRMKQGRRYVAVETGTVRVVGRVTMAIPMTVSTDDVGVDQADQLVHVKGVVALASGNTIQVDDGSGPVNVYLKSSTGIVRPKVKAGDTLDVVGVVGVSTSGVRVLPRMQKDLRVEQVLGASTSASTIVLTPPAASKTQTLWYWSLVGLGILVMSVRPLWKRWTEKRRQP